MRKYRGIISLVCCVCLLAGLLSGCAASESAEPVSQSSSVDSSISSATPYQFTTYLEKNEWVYKRDTHGGPLYRCKANDDVKEIICQSAGDFWVVQNTLYYTDYSDSTIKLCKKDMSTDTITILADNLAVECKNYLYGDWIYYVNEDSGLCRVNIDTFHSEVVNDSGNYWIYRNKIYSQSLTDSSLYRLELDGRKDKTIASVHKSIYQASFDEDYMYFTDIWYPNEDIDNDGNGKLDLNEKRYIYKVSINGGEAIPWIEAYTHEWSIQEGFLYFKNDYPEIEKTGEYKANLQTCEIFQKKY